MLSLQEGDVPEVLADREQLTRNLLQYWECYTQPSGHLAGARGFARLVAAFEALVVDWIDANRIEDEPNEDHAILVECWYAAIMSTAHKIPSANSPPEKLFCMYVPHAAANTTRPE